MLTSFAAVIIKNMINLNSTRPEACEAIKSLEDPTKNGRKYPEQVVIQFASLPLRRVIHIETKNRKRKLKKCN